MTDGPVAIPQPPHPLHALTTYELRDYRRALEQALQSLPAGAPALGPLRERLDLAVAEQDSRAKIASSRA